MRNPFRVAGLEDFTAVIALIVVTSSVLFVTAVHAGPCTAQIGQLESQIRLAASNPVDGPTATQSVAAQLHHQPTPGAVQHAQAAANADADAALDRARKADAQSDSRGCQDALRQARELYGLDVK
jgi:hypothetical protein